MPNLWNRYRWCLRALSNWLNCFAQCTHRFTAFEHWCWVILRRSVQLDDHDAEEWSSSQTGISAVHITHNMNLLYVGWWPSGQGLHSVSTQQAAKAEPRPQAQHPAGLWNQIFTVHKASAKYEESTLPNKTHSWSREVEEGTRGERNYGRKGRQGDWARTVSKGNKKLYSHLCCTNTWNIKRWNNS